jgi:hypothetical protein
MDGQCPSYQSLTLEPCRRTQLSYTRFWEGRTQMQVFASKLTDVVVQCSAFDQASLPVAATQEEIEGHIRFRDTLVHLVSLLHAVGLATLREDYDLDNLCVRPAPVPVCMQGSVPFFHHVCTAYDVVTPVFCFGTTDGPCNAALFYVAHGVSSSWQLQQRDPRVLQMHDSTSPSPQQVLGIRGAQLGGDLREERSNISVSASATPDSDGSPDGARKATHTHHHGSGIYRAFAGTISYLDVFLLRTQPPQRVPYLRLIPPAARLRGCDSLKLARIWWRGLHFRPVNNKFADLSPPRHMLTHGCPPPTEQHPNISITAAPVPVLKPAMKWVGTPKRAG